MPQPLTYPGVYVEEVSSGVRTITGVATSIALFIGWAKKGPIDEARRIFNFGDFEREFGGLHREADLGYSVKHFFDNGGADAYVIRIANLPPAEGPATGGVADTATAKLKRIAFKATSPGKWANNYFVRTTLRKNLTLPDGPQFTLDVFYKDGENAIVVEAYDGLMIDPDDSRYFASVVNATSRLIRVSLIPGADLVANESIQLGTGTGATLGVDGDVVKMDAVVGQLEKLFQQSGIADKIDIFNLVCVPGMTSVDGVKHLQAACAKRRAFLIVDSPSDTNLDNAPAKLQERIGSNPSHAAFYFPWVKATDPLQQIGVRDFPPCGFIAGVMARTDASRGVWKAPAGTDTGLNGAIDFTVKLSDAENGAVNPKGVNCLRTLPAYGNIVWGARTMDGNNDRASEWKYIPVRRMALFLEESLFRGLHWVVFEPNDEPLWSQIRLNVGAFMQSLFRQGAFQGATPKEAYFVKCDRTTTTQDQINQGIVNIHVGFAPLKPAEFVVLRIQQMAGAIAT